MVPLPLGPPFVGIHIGLFYPFNRIGAPHPAGEHAVQREGKDVPIFLCCAGRGILDYGRATCGLLCDAGRGRSGTIYWKIHRKRVLLAGRGEVRSETGAQDHLCCSDGNHPCLSLVGSSTLGCADTATNYPVPQGRHRSLTQRPPLFDGLRPLLTS